MNGFIYEFKKIMFHQNALLFIIAFLLVSTAVLVMTDTPQNAAMEQYRSEYEWYLDRVSGESTTEKSDYLETEASAIADAKNRRQQMMERYYSGEISEADYTLQSAEIEKVLEHQNGFDVVYQQYLYISENPANRCFVQTNGWAGLLSGGTLDFLLLIAILIITTPAFCSEYHCQMDALILTAKEGRKSATYKLIIVLGIVILLCLSVSLIKFAFFTVSYGLPNGAYPLQSIDYFGNSTKQISLLGGYLAITALRCFGGLYLSIVLLLCSVLVKKYALTMMLGAVSVLIPYIGLSTSIVYRLPLPLPFLLAADFFAGSVTINDERTGEQTAIFQEVSETALAVLIAVSAVICLIAIFFILRCNTNHWQAKRRTRRPLLCAAIGIAFVFTLSGCTSGIDADVVYNSASSEKCAGYEAMVDPSTQNLFLKNAETGEVIELPRSPMFRMFSDNESIKSCFCRGSSVYYTLSKTEQHVDRVGSYNSSFTKISVVELNLETFVEHTIFEKVVDSERSLLGIAYQAGDKWAFLQHHHSFFLNSTNIFFVGNNSITQVNRLTGRIENLKIPTDGNVAFDGRNIFFINTQSELEKFDTLDGSSTAYEGIIAYDFSLSENAIYYINRMDSNHVYVCSLDGAHTSMVSDIVAMAVSSDEANIYITAKFDGEQTEIPKSFY